MDRALRQGADGVEVDVRLTADGIPVIHHDPGMRRTAGDPRSVASIAYRDLPTVGGHRVPLLAEVVDLVGTRGRLIVELKTSHRTRGGAVNTVAAVVTALRKHRLHDVVVSSFDRPRVLQLRLAGLPVETALLGRPGVPFGLVLRRGHCDGHRQVHPHVTSVLAQPELVRVAAEVGISVTTWTVHRREDLAGLLQAGVDAAICDDPRAARDLLVQPESLPRAG